MAFANKQKLVIEGENKTKRAFGQITRSLGTVGKHAARVGKVVGIGLGAGVAGLVALTKQTLNQADALGKLSKQTGLTVEELQSYEFAAGQSGVASANFNTGVQAFAKRMGELKNETGGLFTFLKKFDPEFATILAGAENTGEAFRLMADRMAQIEDPATRAALGAAAFSRSAGVEMATLLAEGSEGLSKYTEELAKTGSVMSSEGVAASEKFNDALDKLSRSTLGAFRKAIVDLAPQLQEWAEWLAEKAPGAVQELVKWLQEAGPSFASFAEGIGKIIEVVATVAGAIHDFATGLGEAVAKVVLFASDIVDSFATMRDDVVEFVQTMVEDVTRWFTAPFDAIADKVSGWTDSVSGFFKGMWDAVSNQSYVPDMIMDIGEWFDKLPGVMVDPAFDATDRVTGAFSTLRDSISTILSDILRGTKSFGDSLLSVLESIANRILDRVIGRVTDGLLSAFGFGGGGSGGGALSFSGIAKAGKAGLAKIGQLFGGGAAAAPVAGGGTTAVSLGTSLHGGAQFSLGGGGGAAAGGTTAAWVQGIGWVSVPFIASALFNKFRRPSPASKALPILEAGMGARGPLGLSTAEGGGVGFAGGANIDFARSFAESQGLHAAEGIRPGFLALERFQEDRGRIIGREALGAEEMLKVLEDAERKFEQLKTLGARTFEALGVGAREMGEILRDGIVDQTEQARLGVIGLGETTAAQFGEILEAVDRGQLRLKALRGEVALNQEEMALLGELGFDTAQLIADGFLTASGTAGQALRDLVANGVNGFRELEGAAAAAASAAASVGGGALEIGRGGSQTGSRDPALTAEARRLATTRTTARGPGAGK